MRRALKISAVCLLLAGLAYAANTKLRSVNIVNSVIDATTDTFNGLGTGCVGSTSGALNNSNCFGAPSALVSTAISSGQTISSTSPTSLASISVSQPASGCAWRAIASYSFSWGGGSNQSDVTAEIWDGSAGFAGSNNGSSNGSSGGHASLSASGLSPSYLTSTSSKTLTLYAESTTTSNPATVSGISFGSPISGAAVYQLQAWGACIN